MIPDRPILTGIGSPNSGFIYGRCLRLTEFLPSRLRGVRARYREVPDDEEPVEKARLQFKRYLGTAGQKVPTLLLEKKFVGRCVCG